MKKMAWFLVLALMLTCLTPVLAEETVTYGEAPMLAALVEAGELPPVEERLPEVPKVSCEILDEYLDFEIGSYGGTLKHVSDDVNWDADVFVACDEALFTCASVNSGEVTPNLLQDVEVNEDNTEFIFTLRKGLKWSDGTEVTMEDFRFTFEDVIFNTELTPVIAAKMRAGGSSEAAPLEYEIIDDEHFAIRFESSYGGFLVSIAIAGWAGYTDYLKPAEYLKPFHISYAEECHGSLDAFYEFIAPFAKVMGYDDPTEEGVWTYVFNQIDVTNWEITNTNYCLATRFFEGCGLEKNMPMLYAWIMTDSNGTINTWTRNPYYHKVDAEGNQLPYIDYLTSILVQDGQMVQLAYAAGDADFGQGVTMVDNITLYRENQDTSHNESYVTSNHNNPTDCVININYGLNGDGTVKDDELCQSYQEVMPNVQFRQALAMAVDAEEIIDAVYKGMADPNPYFNCVHDIDGANAILDELGLADIDGDGFRESPSGKKLQWFIFTDAAATDQVPVCELLCEYWGEIGLNVGVQPTDPTLLATMLEANEIPMRVSWYHSNVTWHYLDFGQSHFAPLYNAWINAGGLSGELTDESAGLEPTEEIKDIYRLIQSLMAVTPDKAVSDVLPEIMTKMGEQVLLLEPICNVQQCVVIDEDVGNVPTGGLGIGWSFSREQMFFHDPDNH